MDYAHSEGDNIFRFNFIQTFLKVNNITIYLNFFAFKVVIERNNYTVRYISDTEG